MDTPNRLQVALKKILESVNLTQLAESTGISRNTLKSYRLGHRAAPAESIRKIAAGLRSQGRALLTEADRLEAELRRNP